jgi:hypothetical protein
VLLEERDHPVVQLDANGDIYVQSNRRLISYDAGGTVRRSADSLACEYCGPWGVGAPSLLVGDELVVLCDDSGAEICSVNMLDDSLNWRSNIDDSIDGSPAVAQDGTIHLTSGWVAL